MMKPTNGCSLQKIEMESVNGSRTAKKSIAKSYRKYYRMRMLAEANTQSVIKRLDHLEKIISTASLIETISSNEEHISNIQPNAQSSEGGKDVNQQLQRPKFAGKQYENPLTFMSDLEKYHRMSGMREDKLVMAMDCLTGAAELWAKIYKDGWNSFEEFSQEFIKFYWRESVQRTIRTRLLTETWHQKAGTMTDHFLRWYHKGKSLSISMSDDQLIGDIFKHFPGDVQRLLSVRSDWDVKGVIEFLRSLDSIGTSSREDEFLSRDYNRGAVGNASRVMGRVAPPRRQRDFDDRPEFVQGGAVLTGGGRECDNTKSHPLVIAQCGIGDQQMKMQGN